MQRTNPSLTPTLRSARLLLRAPTEADAPALLEISYYDGVRAQDGAEVLDMLQKIGADVSRGESLHWLICLQDSGEVAGTCGFYRGYPENTGELGYLLKAAYRGQGYMSKALRAVIAYGFGTMRLERLVAYTAADNRASVGVLKRLSFEQVELMGTKTGEAAADTLLTFALSAQQVRAQRAGLEGDPGS